jgi:hypothetical protein
LVNAARQPPNRASGAPLISAVIAPLINTLVLTL